VGRGHHIKLGAVSSLNQRKQGLSSSSSQVGALATHPNIRLKQHQRTILPFLIVEALGDFSLLNGSLFNPLYLQLYLGNIWIAISVHSKAIEGENYMIDIITKDYFI
jgi:hypothetical protein